MRLVLRVAAAVLIAVAVYAVAAFSSMVFLVAGLRIGLISCMWGANLVALISSGLVTWACLRATRTWTTRRLSILVSATLCAIAFAALGICCLTTRLGFFEGYDSDRKAVEPERINAYLVNWTGTALPHSAKEVRVVILEGVDTFMVLKFRSTDEDIQRFIEQTQSRWKDSLVAGHGPAPDWVEQIATREWWTPPTDSDWLLYPGFLFIQVDKQSHTVYLAVMES